MKINSAKISPGLLLTIIIALMTASLVLLRITLAISYLPEIGGVSINVMYGIIRILSGSELYTNPEVAPFPIIQYMPLHFHLVALAGKAMMISKDIHAMTVLNRLFCLALDICSTLLITRTLIKTLSLKSNIAWPLSFIYFLSIPSIIYGRVDNLYLFLFIATISILLKNILRSESNNKSMKDIFIAGVVCALAICTKQTGIFLLVFCSIFFLFISKSLKTILIFYAGLLLSGFIVALWLYPVSLEAFKLNIIDGVKNGINVNWFMEVILKNFFMKFSYVLGMGLLAAILLYKNRHLKTAAFLSLGIIWYFLIASLSAFKAGSGPNYYLEFIVLSLFGISILIKNTSFINSTGTLFALVLSPFFVIAAANDKGWGDLGMMKKSKKDYFNCIEVAEYIKPKIKFEEWVLSDFHKENSLNLMLTDQALFPCREVALYFTRPQGVFHFSEFKKLIENGSVSFLITYKEDTLSEFIDEPLLNYCTDTTIGNYTIYRLSNKN